MIEYYINGDKVSHDRFDRDVTDNINLNIGFDIKESYIHGQLVRMEMIYEDDED